MGSPNLNDRSQEGDRDSEIALVVEDAAEVQTTMGGQPFAAAQFAAGLRRRLWKGMSARGAVYASTEADAPA
jgi:phospholipase D1/2